MKINISKAWLLKMAKLEGDSEIGAGSPIPEDLTEREKKLAEALRLVEEEENLSQQTLNRLDDLLNRICNVLKGPPPEDMLYSYHDLPEVAQALVDENKLACTKFKQQKEEIEARDEAIEQLSAELSALQQREVKLVEALKEPMTYLAIHGWDINKIQQALSNSAPHAEKWLAEHDAKKP